MTDGGYQGRISQRKMSKLNEDWVNRRARVKLGRLLVHSAIDPRGQERTGGCDRFVDKARQLDGFAIKTKNNVPDGGTTSRERNTVRVTSEMRLARKELARRVRRKSKAGSNVWCMGAVYLGQRYMGQQSFVDDVLGNQNRANRICFH